MFSDKHMFEQVVHNCDMITNNPFDGELCRESVTRVLWASVQKIWN